MDFTPSFWLMYAAFIRTAAATFPVKVHIMASYLHRKGGVVLNTAFENVLLIGTFSQIGGLSSFAD